MSISPKTLIPWYEWGDMADLKEAVKEASKILLVLPERASDKDYFAALQIQRIAPQKTEILAPEAKEAEWKDVFGSPGGKREFVIQINTALSPVDELRYEKSDSTLSIYLAHPGRFNEGALSYREYIAPADLFITVGFRSEAEAEKAVEKLPRKGAARHIWMEGDANHAPAPEKLPPPSAGLLGRLVVRSRIDPDTNTLWSFLTKDDFAKTETTPEELPQLMEAYASFAHLPPHALVFWQYGAEGTQGFFRSEETSLLNIVADRIGKTLAYPKTVPLPPYSNFIEAEMEVRKLLRELKVR